MIDKYGFKLGSEKYEFFMKPIKYFGQINDKNGRRPETTKDMLPLNNVTNLQAFLSLANNYIIYIPKMYDLRALLNDLLKKGANRI